MLRLGHFWVLFLVRWRDSNSLWRSLVAKEMHVALFWCMHVGVFWMCKGRDLWVSHNLTGCMLFGASRSGCLWAHVDVENSLKAPKLVGRGHMGLPKNPLRALHASGQRASAAPKKLELRPPDLGMTLAFLQVACPYDPYERTSFSRSKIQYICSLSLSKISNWLRFPFRSETVNKVCN